MIRSLRLRLLITTSIVSSTILALLCVAIYGFMWHRLLSEFDTGLLIKARTLAAMVEASPDRISFDADLDQMPEFSSSGRRPEYFQIWLADGTVLKRSPSLGTNDLPKSIAKSGTDSTTIMLPNGRRGRAMTMTFTIHLEQTDGQPIRKIKPHSEATVVLAARPIEMNNALDDLGWLSTVACATAVVISGFALVKIVNRAVKPVDELATQIGQLQEIDLSRRLEGTRVPLELMPVVEKLNGLLARLEQSFAREKSFTADVAHELRTPLAGIQTSLEVCRSRPRNTADYESTLDDCRSMTDRLQALIENLLLLARADSGQLPVRNQEVDLYQLIQECWLPLLNRVNQKQLTVECDHSGDNIAHTDADKMRIVLCNLLENAVSYVNDAGHIRWSIRREAQQIHITISNSASQVSPADADRIFDRFWRGDESRTDTGIHCGLGLSLCKRFVTLLKGTIDIETQIDGDFTVRLILPATRAMAIGIL